MYIFQGRSQNYENRLLVSSCLSVRLSVHPSACKTSAPTWHIFIKFGRGVFLENMSRKFKFHEVFTRH
jgi:hypothetical protein